MSDETVILTASEYYSKIWAPLNERHSSQITQVGFLPVSSISDLVLTLRVKTELQQDPKLRYYTFSTGCQQSRSKLTQVNLLRDSSLQHDDYLPTGTTFYVWCGFDRHLPRQSS